MSEQQQLAGLPEDALPANSQMEGLGLEGGCAEGEEFFFTARKLICLAPDPGFSPTFPILIGYSSLLKDSACHFLTSLPLSLVLVLPLHQPPTDPPTPELSD